MGKLSFFFLLFFSSLHVSAQQTKPVPAARPAAATINIPAAATKTTSGIAQYLNSRYQTPLDKITAIYYWLASNVAYDVQGFATAPMYYEKQAIITQTLATRKALCQGYAEVFQELCAKTGIPSYLVTGFVIPKSTNTPMSHAWVAAQLAGQWYLFDPTWGAGIVEKNVFVPRLNPNYFMVSPDKMIQTHIPFDPLFQFLPQPISYHAFMTKKPSPATAKTRTFSFRDSLVTYDKSSEKARLVGSIRRMEANAVIPPVVLEHLNHFKRNLGVARQNETADRYNVVVDLYNQGIEGINRFTRYKNKQFKPSKPEQEVKLFTKDSRAQLTQAQLLLRQIKPVDNPKLLLSLQNMTQAIDKALDQVTQQEKFLETYYKTPVAQRPTLFYKQALAEQ